jgi:hypothetical protein
MPATDNYKELFRQTTILEIISMFQSLLDALDIEPEEALALAGAIHAGLRDPQGLDGPVYARYARAMALMSHHLPEVHEHVVSNWHLPIVKPPVSKRKREYTDSLFDDTAVMPIPGSKDT